MITSTSNQRIRNLKKLMASARRRKEEGCFIVEGPRMFFEIPGDRLKEAYVTGTFAEKYRNRLKSYDYELVEDRVMKSLSDTRTPQGVIGVVRRQEMTLADLLNASDNPCFFLLENLQDPGNLGTILRTAEGAGITGVVVDNHCADPYNTKVVRSTMGAIFRVPLLITANLPEVCRKMKKAGVCIYAGDLDGDPLYKGDYRGPSAFLIGNEGNGLTREIRDQADRSIRIPMKGNVESLNAATAGTVIMYEVLRQREWAD